MQSLRIHKVNSLIQKHISQIINIQFSDHVSYTNINYIDTSKDLASTNIYVSFAVTNQEEEFKKLIKIKNLVQKYFGHTIKLKKTPKIRFILDTNIDKINKIEKILDKISKNEKR
jgi:ribosome-binding factor A